MHVSADAADVAQPNLSYSKAIKNEGNIVYDVHAVPDNMLSQPHGPQVLAPNVPPIGHNWLDLFLLLLFDLRKNRGSRWSERSTWVNSFHSSSILNGLIRLITRNGDLLSLRQSIAQLSLTPHF